jgi:hypothetical protein
VLDRRSIGARPVHEIKVDVKQSIVESIDRVAAREVDVHGRSAALDDGRDRASSSSAPRGMLARSMISATRASVGTTTSARSGRGRRAGIGLVLGSSFARSRVRALSSPGENYNPQVAMDAARASEILGLGQNATSDELVKAHREMLDKYAQDESKCGEVERAYDVLLMKSFNRRTKGDTVDKTVKYADVVPPIDRLAAAMPAWTKEAGSALPPAPRFSAPSQASLSQTGALFGAIAVVTLVQGFAQPQGMDNPTGLEIAAALGATVWFMNKKRVSLGRSAALAFGFLLVGSLFGGAVQEWLRVDIVPFAGISSPSTIVSEFGILALFFAAACFD